MLEFVSRLWFHRPHIELDRDLGWGLKADFYHEFQMPGKPRFSTNSLGLREGGEVDGDLILVLGDSFTAEPGVTNQGMWFSILASELGNIDKKPYRVMAGGAGGYGTAQQLLLARRLKHLIKPKVLILQFCMNDFVNNHMEWEQYSVQRHQIHLRPYTRDGQTFVYQKSWAASLYRSPVFAHWRGFYLVDLLVQELQRRIYDSYFRPIDTVLERRFEEESRLLTTRLLSQIRSEFLDSEAYLLNVSSWDEVAIEAGFKPLKSHLLALEESAAQGESIHFSDKVHWNALGNQIVGRFAAREISEIRGLNSQ
ncbi:MAG: SGNH/GDSL hydrolase family protein [Candidatus Cloacimonetes bacterium]|nr:SGNH/GDSL hydrolase family protein [Candidatus Cloacimonadota bacterium]